MHDHALRDALVVRREQPVPELTVLTVSGEIDLATAPSLREELARTRTQATVVDLSGVGFLAAAGLSVLLAASETARREGRRFGLIGVAGAARRALEVSGVAALVPSYPALADALTD